MQGLQIFVTGGTFDKEYNEITGKLYFQHTHLPEMLRLGRCNRHFDIETLMMVDSLEMTEEQRREIAIACQNTDHQRILITHGTDTMVETARVIASHNLSKTIVLTGAMIPYKFGSSDGLFNLGSALAFADVLPHGVYVAMNGSYYHWNSVRKDRAAGKFEST